MVDELSQLPRYVPVRLRCMKHSASSRSNISRQTARTTPISTYCDKDDALDATATKTSDEIERLITTRINYWLLLVLDSLLAPPLIEHRWTQNTLLHKLLWRWTINVVIFSWQLTLTFDLEDWVSAKTPTPLVCEILTRPAANAVKKSPHLSGRGCRIDPRHLQS